MGAVVRSPRLLTPPLEVWLEPTDSCPGGCLLCPRGRGEDADGDGRFMGEDVFRRALSDLRRWRPTVRLYHRGEPLLHPRLVEMARALARAGCRVVLHTGLSAPSAVPVEELLAAGLGELVISLGAATAEGFARLRPGICREAVLERARRLAALGRPRTTRLVVELFLLGDVRAEVRAARALFADNPPDGIRLRPVHNWAGAIDSPLFPSVDGFPAAARRGRLFPRSRCMFPFYAMVVLWDGRVAACPQDVEARLVVGDLREQPLRRIWRGEGLGRLRRRSRSDLAANRPCADCSLLRDRGFLGLPLGRIFRFGWRKVLG